MFAWCACILILFVLSGCILITDASTRLAYDIRDAALKLESSQESEIEITHAPLAWPDGIDSDYRVLIQTTESTTKPSGSMAIGNSATSYHRRFVSVPKTLYITKKKGESIKILLRKTDKPWHYKGDGETLKGDKTIELIRLE